MTESHRSNNMIYCDILQYYTQQYIEFFSPIFHQYFLTAVTFVQMHQWWLALGCFYINTYLQ